MQNSRSIIDKTLKEYCFEICCKSFVFNSFTIFGNTYQWDFKSRARKDIKTFSTRVLNSLTCTHYCYSHINNLILLFDPMLFSPIGPPEVIIWQARVFVIPCITPVIESFDEHRYSNSILQAIQRLGFFVAISKIVLITSSKTETLAVYMYICMESYIRLATQHTSCLLLGLLPPFGK